MKFKDFLNLIKKMLFAIVKAVDALEGGQIGDGIFHIIPLSGTFCSSFYNTIIPFYFYKSRTIFHKFRRNTSKYNSDGDFSPSFLLNSFKNSVVTEKIQNRTDSVQLRQLNTFARFSRDQRSLGAEQSNNLGNCAFGAPECAQFLVVELAIIQFAVIEFHGSNPLSFIYINIIPHIFGKSR